MRESMTDDLSNIFHIATGQLCDSLIEDARHPVDGTPDGCCGLDLSYKPPYFDDELPDLRLNAAGGMVLIRAVKTQTEPHLRFNRYTTKSTTSAAKNIIIPGTSYILLGDSIGHRDERRMTIRQFQTELYDNIHLDSKSDTPPPIPPIEDHLTPITEERWWEMKHRFHYPAATIAMLWVVVWFANVQYAKCAVGGCGEFVDPTRQHDRNSKHLCDRHQAYLCYVCNRITQANTRLMFKCHYSAASTCRKLCFECRADIAINGKCLDCGAEKYSVPVFVPFRQRPEIIEYEALHKRMLGPIAKIGDFD